MTHEFDTAGELTAGVAGRPGAWRFIQGFAAHWADPLTDDDGSAEEDLASVEERLGVRLPQALREAYFLFGRRSDLTSNHDALLTPAGLYVDEAGEALVFRHENQGAASWGILLTDFAHDDPAVVIRADLADKAAEKWESWLERFSLACVEIVLSESLHAPEELTDFLDAPDDEALRLLDRHCTPLPFPACPTGSAEPGTRWFLGSDVLLRDDEGTALLARARTTEALDRIRDMIPGDWLNDYR